MREIEALRREKEDRERQLELENEALRLEASQLKGELDAIMRELQLIMNTKMSLEMEIAAYRKLLESEENRSDVPTEYDLNSDRPMHCSHSRRETHNNADGDQNVEYKRSFNTHFCVLMNMHILVIKSHDHVNAYNTIRLRQTFLLGLLVNNGRL